MAKKAPVIDSEYLELDTLLEEVMVEFETNPQYFQAMEIFVKRRISYRDFERRIANYPEIKKKMDILEEMEEARIIEKGMLRKGDPYMSQFILERKYGYNEPRKKIKSSRELVEDMITDVAARRSTAGGKFAEEEDTFDILAEGGDDDDGDDLSDDEPLNAEIEEETARGKAIEVAEDDYDEDADFQARKVAANKKSKR